MGMSYLGAPYEYDLFFSYAYAERKAESELLKAWSQKVAERITDLLMLGFNAQAGQAVFRVFLDKRELQAGTPLTDRLEESARGSAILVVMLSPFYKAQPWCQNELNWFFEQARQDGRDYEQTLLLRVMPTPREQTPELLVDSAGEPRQAIEFHDGFLPLGIVEASKDRLEAAIATAVQQAAAKVKRYKELRSARQMQQAQATVPNAPRLYLSGSLGDPQAWRTARARLASSATVFPLRAPRPQANDALAQQQTAARLAELEACDGLVVLRTAYDDASDQQVLGAMNEVNWLVQNRGKILPWAVLDDIPAGEDEEPGDWVMPRVPRISARSPTWDGDLIRRLQEAAQANGGAA